MTAPVHEWAEPDAYETGCFEVVEYRRHIECAAWRWCPDTHRVTCKGHDEPVLLGYVIPIPDGDVRTVSVHLVGQP